MNRIASSAIAAVIAVTSLSACGTAASAPPPVTAGTVISKEIDTDAKHSDKLKKDCDAAKKKGKKPLKCKSYFKNPKARVFDDYVLILRTPDGRTGEVDVDDVTYATVQVGQQFDSQVVN
jgi:hypothetical protein